ncbi:glucose 1-dehydrogenase [Brevibacillus choshinensis]|uniref:SDR family NAD(P)-dependent oxidoreductase n=1 Tax=Brevibacillus choshinensis TaxID=54911 RepID=UPI002E208B09|nr:glucose 1-dehydrogenase [Brevibacillus choshinensis]MED4754391.1 glucose 1-dehydrogenase [Brevibacillus choshinensis]MED4782593.1 glucose 1-dehydrogenase [Brevibacillus choshinensis]
MSHEKQVAVVTGAASGIGRATSIKFAENGYRVVLVDFNEELGRETLSMIQNNGGEGIFVKADVSKPEDVENYVKQAMETYGQMDVLFNNAGVIQKFAPFTEVEIEEYERIMSINVKSIFLGMKNVLPIMEQQGKGAIINTASSAGIRPEHSIAVYSASKHAVIGLTKGASIEYAKKGVRINAVCPGGIETAIFKSVADTFANGGYVPEELSPMRMGRHGQPNEIAEVVLFLASDKASFMTGSVVAVDGSLTV